MALLVRDGFFRTSGATKRFRYVDFWQSDRFLPFNILQSRYAAHAIAQHIAEVCKRSWPALADGAAPQFENILLAAVVVLVENHRPLTDLPTLLTNKVLREALLANVTDPRIVEFFHDRFDLWGKETPLMIESTLRRLFPCPSLNKVRFLLMRRYLSGPDYLYGNTKY